MSAIEFAANCGVTLVGKLSKRIAKSEKWNPAKGAFVTVCTTYYIDEVGTEVVQGAKKGTWSIITADGGLF